MFSVSAIKNNRPFLVWSAIAAFCLVFAIVYECFSFGVYSAAMIFLFAWPLLLGALPSLLMPRGTSRFWNDGVLLLTAGSLLTGVFEIYGTSSSLTGWFRILGIACRVIGAVTWHGSTVRCADEKRF